MSRFTKLLLLLMMSTVVSIMGVARVEANDYEASDIARIYIESDAVKDINELTKEEYADAAITVVNKDGTVNVYDAGAKVKLRGNSTSKTEKKPLKIKFSKKYSVLGMDEGKKWNLLANAFDKTMMRNTLCFNLAEKMGLAYTVEEEYADVYYNGVLQGNYLVTEPVETGEGRVEIAEDELTGDFMIELERERQEADVTYVYTGLGLRFAVNSPEIPTKAQVDGINKWTEKVENALKTYRYSEYSKYINVDSFVNYYILTELFKPVDFNYSSTRFYVKDGVMYAGPVWDVDLSCGNASQRFYRAYYNGNVSYEGLFCTEMKWFGYLIKSDEFVDRVNARLKAMLPVIENVYKTNSLGKNQIDILIDMYGKSFNRNYESTARGGAGWSVTKRYSLCDNRLGLEHDSPATTFSGNVENLRSWLSNRVTYLKKEWSGIRNNKMSYLSLSKKSATRIELRWIKRGIADGYEIYCKPSGGKYKLIKTITNGNTGKFVAGKLKSGVRFYFKVRSYVKTEKGKVYSGYITSSLKMPLGGTKPKAKKVGRKLTVKWKRVKAADGYIVYLKKGNGKYKKVKTIKNNKTVKYVKKNCKLKSKYSVKVKAYVTYKGKKYIAK